ncbi:MAG: hypothetical protein WBA25_18625, partial [Jannaschia sp.]
MPAHLPPQLTLDLEAVLSPPRFATYVRACGGDTGRAIALYCWNTEIAAALYTPLQFAEITVRNGAAEAIERVFGSDWHQNMAFRNGIRAKVGRYRMRGDLEALARRHKTAGAVVAELKFAFWQHLFVSTQDGRLWSHHLRNVFPAIPAVLSDGQARETIHDHIQTVRTLRNRIAHHEPIISRDRTADLRAARTLIDWRRPT